MAAPTAAPSRQTLLRNPPSDSSFTSLSSATSDYTASTSSSSQLGTSYTSNASSSHKGGILRPAQVPSPSPPAAGEAGGPAPGGATPEEAGAPSSSPPGSSPPCSSSISFAPLPPTPIRRRASIAVGVAARGQLLRSQAGCGGGSSKHRPQGQIQYVAMTDEEWEAYKRQFSRGQVANPKDDDLPDLGTLALKGARKLGSMVSAARARRASASSNASSQSSATTSSTSSSPPSSVGACAVLVRPPMEEEEEEEEGVSPPPSRPRSPPPPTAMDEDEDEGEQSADMDSEFGGSSVVEEEDEEEIGASPSPPSLHGAPVEKRWHDLDDSGGAAGGGTGSGEVTPRRRGSFSGTTDFPVHGHDAFVLGFNQKLALEGGSDGGAWPPPRAVGEP